MAVNCRNFSASRLKKTAGQHHPHVHARWLMAASRRAFLVRMFISQSPHGQGLDPDRVHISAWLAARS